MSYVSPAPRSAKGYEQLTVSSTAVGLASVPNGCNYAIIKVTAANIRFRDDGTDPTTSAGFPVAVDDIIRYPGDPRDLKFIRDDAADATLEVAYYRA